VLFGAEPLGGYMAGVCVSGVMWAIFQNNAGGAWDNAKKSFEAGVEIKGEMTYKGSEAHKAAVTGDTVGDPFKDTSGPSMNILIKLTCLVSLVIAPIIGSHDVETAVAQEIRKEIRVEVDASEADMMEATITTTTSEDGTVKTEVKKIKGTEAEVEASIAAVKEVELHVKN
jgi:K(+)-stimulated pyrophosphate-energized sodium pump